MPKHFLVFVELWLNLCHKNNLTWFFIAFTFLQGSSKAAENIGLWPQFSISPMEMSIHEKICKLALQNCKIPGIIFSGIVIDI